MPICPALHTRKATVNVEMRVPAKARKRVGPICSNKAPTSILYPAAKMMGGRSQTWRERERVE